MEKINKDRLFAAGSMLLALYLGIMSFGYPVESSFFPRALSVLLGFLSILLIIRLSLTARKKRPGQKEPDKSPAFSYQNEWITLKSAGLVFGSIIIYGLLIQVVNYEASSIIFLAVMMVILGFKRPLIVAGLSVGLMLLLYGIFFKLLGVSRPESLLFS